MLRRGKKIPGVIRILILGSVRYFEVDIDRIDGMTFKQMNSFKNGEADYPALKFYRSSEYYPTEDIFSDEEIAEMEVIVSSSDIPPFYRTRDGELIWLEKIKNRLVWHNC